jgi:hypothetical protein
MNSNQRSEMNNQTNNGANEKGTPGSKGKTADGPMDHTYPQGASQQQGAPGGGSSDTQQSGMGPGAAGAGSGSDLPGGSMQTQQSGGTGAVQGITDSHQREMEKRSGAYGQLEQPVGGRGNQQSGTQGGGQMGPQSTTPPGRQGGSMGSQQNGTQGGGQLGRAAGTPSVQQGGSMNAQQSTDRSGAQTGAAGADSGPAVHESNDVAGGYPRSPGGANRLAADRKMDDDTGFSNTVNKQSEVDEGTKQAEQSNVGRRDDMTPD